MQSFKEGDIVYLETKRGIYWHARGVIEGKRWRALETSSTSIYIQ